MITYEEILAGISHNISDKLAKVYNTGIMISVLEVSDILAELR